MSGRNGQELLSTWVPAEVAAAFKAQARVAEGGVAAALRRLVAEAVDSAQPHEGLHGASPPGPASPALAAIAPRGVGHGEQVSVRLKAPERAMLAQAARAQGTSPANWMRSLALVHLARRPQWNPAELEALRELFRELRAIGTNVNQVAHAVNAAAKAGQGLEGTEEQALAVREAAERVRLEMRRVVAVMSGNFDYWGLPDAERPTAAPGALERAAAEVRAAEAQRKGRPRRRPARFA